jgi:hypothetical protein
MDESAAVRLELAGELLEAVEDWRRRQRPKIPSRREAVVQLIELGLKGDLKLAQPH